MKKGEFKRMLNVRPSKATYDSVDLGVANAKPTGKFLAAVPVGGEMSNFPNLLFGESGHTVSGSLLSSLAILAIAICAILGLCSGKEMGGVATKGIVASVTNKMAVGYRAIRQFVGDAMGRQHFTVRVFELAVALNNGGLPFPAFARFTAGDFRPESINRAWGKTRGSGMLLHSNVSFVDLLMPPSDSRRCGGNFIGCYSFNYSTIEAGVQRV